MNIRLQTAHGEEIKLSPFIPSSLRQLRIPDSICRGAAGPFGHVLFQELEGDNITALYHTLFFNQAEQLTYSSNRPAIRLQISLRNSYYYQSQEFGTGVLHERGLSLNYTPSVHAVLKLRKQEAYNHLTIYYPKKYLQNQTVSFPSLIGFLQQAEAGHAVQFNEYYCIADASILALVDNMLECGYKGELRKVFLESLALEILLSSLLRITGTKPRERIIISETESAHIYEAKALILQTMSKPFSLPALSRETGLSAYKLNNGFKGIFGMGVMEFLLEARMKKAHQVLLETNTPVSAVAESSGYSHHHAFELAFKKYFGYTPAFVQRSVKR